MNYLAHIYLARQSGDAMVGALLGDFVKANRADAYAGEIRREIYLHRKIDTFTDSHPVITDAKRLFPEGRRRFAGILLDVFYDHVLAGSWTNYCDIPLEDFVGNFYEELLSRNDVLPDELKFVAGRMTEQDWLGSYKEFPAIETAIHRMSQRLSRNNHLLREGLHDLKEHYALLSSGFHAMFPDLQLYTCNERRKLYEARR
jgi:acyl carrier protein phosphodiesterase